MFSEGKGRYQWHEWVKKFAYSQKIIDYCQKIIDYCHW